MRQSRNSTRRSRDTDIDRSVRKRGFRSRILSATFRNHAQWSELGGGLVASPRFSWQQTLNASRIDPVRRMDEPVDPPSMPALSAKVPDFDRA